MAVPLRTPQRPITLAEIEQRVTTYQQALDEATHQVEVAEQDLRSAQFQRDRLKRQVEAWQAFAKTLKELR